MANKDYNDDYLDKDHLEDDEEMDEIEEKMIGDHMVEERFDDDWLNEGKKFNLFDNFFTGFIIAILLSVITVRLVTLSSLPNMGIVDVLKHVYESSNFQTIMMTAIIPNLIFFFILYKMEKWKANYGVIVASLLMTAFLFLHIA
ncbi:MAG: hypothetical protein MJZ14_08410 [Paludibacteraceae bacterium]|nr:hypothetical protein [Paludibacteraceae bacterium]